MEFEDAYSMWTEGRLTRELARAGNGKASEAAGSVSWNGPARGEPLLRIRKTPPRLCSCKLVSG